MRNHSSFTILPIIFFLAFFSACNEDEKQIPPPEIYLASETSEIEISVGDTITLEPKITYNVEGRYEWRKNDERLPNTEPFLLDTATNLGRIEYFFSVVTPYGADSMSIPVDVIVLADFTKLFPENLKTDSSWTGTPDTAGFSYSDIFFPTHFEESDSSWQGFGFSNIKSTTNDEEKIPQNSVYASTSSRNVFSVVKQPNGSDYTPPTLKFDDNKNHRLKSMEINNTTLGVFLLKYGNENFDRMGYPSNTDPDWFKITITGLDVAGAVIGTQDFFLADYRFDNYKRDYIVDSWTEIDLTGLGKVNRVQFSLSSNKTNEAGEMITPEEFCIDNIKVLN
jgi:hypothetical protein